MTDHTPEPWTYRKMPEFRQVRIFCGARLMTTIRYGSAREAPAAVDLAARISACVNACAGIPTEQLEDFNATKAHVAAKAQSLDIERAEVCIRACAGIPTEQLGDVKALRDRLAESQRILASYCRSLKGQGNDTQAEAVKRHLDKNKAALASFREDRTLIPGALS